MAYLRFITADESMVIGRLLTKYPVLIPLSVQNNTITCICDLNATNLAEVSIPKRFESYSLEFGSLSFSPCEVVSRVDVPFVDGIGEAKKRHAVRLFKEHKNLSSIGISMKATAGKWTDQPCIQFSVHSKGVFDGDTALPTELDGFPCDVISGTSVLFSSGRLANIEIKARVQDLEAAKRLAATLATEHGGTHVQVDTYFRTQQGNLKLRITDGAAHGELIPYMRPNAAAPKRSDYQVLRCPNAAQVLDLLSAILGVHVRVEKRRTVERVDNVRIHLDEVSGLAGGFLELEAVWDGAPEREAHERAKCDRLMTQLGVQPTDLIAAGYMALVLDAQQQIKPV